ncbi:hypothetical protein [Streptomyces sp. NBC_00199]|uniref:hypothetical protein n=1 Tax=Streptomyces sp. NBC_00199 TaxID=2975678 RepID=UPI002256CF05|nr:hypothetical protein [Streptomyces sp. NBC_00199]MCX5267521.1 hypothetical protein [Streptomyces sp. NBC_00199]
MFEIRIICEPADSDRVADALETAFKAGRVTVFPTRDGKRQRLYLTADHAEVWPGPEQAYADAPSIHSELDWIAHTLGTTACYSKLERGFYLRKAAVLDRIALADGADYRDDDTAYIAAKFVVVLDDAHADCDPRAYVRQQYALMAADGH